MYELDFDILVEYANDLGVASRSYVRQCQSNGRKPEAVYGRLCKNKTLVDLVDTGLYATVVFSILNTFYPNGSAYEVLKLLLFPENISTHLDKYATYAQLDSKEAAILYAHIMRFNLLLGKVDETYNSDVDKLLGIHVSDNTADGVMNKVDRELGELHGRHLVTAVLCAIYRRLITKNRVLVLKFNGSWLQFNIDTLLEIQDVKGCYILSTFMSQTTRRTTYAGVTLYIENRVDVKSAQLRVWPVPRTVLYMHLISNIATLLNIVANCRMADAVAFGETFDKLAGTELDRIGCADVFRWSKLVMSTPGKDVIADVWNKHVVLTMRDKVTGIVECNDPDYWAVTRDVGDALVGNLKNILSKYIPDQDLLQECMSDLKKGYYKV